MAITKERLQELIKQGTTIYNVDYKSNNVEPINLLFTTIDGNTRHIKGEEEGTIFETKEQAEWYLKYHATRTEELNLPTFEEFMQFSQQRPCYNITFMEGRSKYICFLDKTPEDGMYICLYDKTFDEDIFYELATEENYIKACDLCLKLFKGEEV